MMKIFRYLGIGEKQRTLLVVLIIVVIVLSLYNSQLVTVRAYIPQCKDTNDDTSNYDGYIIKFNEEPLSIFKHRFEDSIKSVCSHLTEQFFNQILSEKVLQYKNKILSLHRKAKEDILNLFDGNYSSESIFQREFIFLFNGIAIKKIPDAILEKVKDLPYISDIYPNNQLRIFLDKSVHIINADDVWHLHDSQGRSITGKDVTIAFLDTGVNYTHPDLRDNFVGGYDFVNDDNDPMDDNGHGTHVAGIAVGRGNASDYRYVGVAPDAKFYSFKILNETGEGDLSLFLAGMERAVDPNGDGDISDHVDIISISAGDPEGNPNDGLSLVSDYAVSLGVVVIAAAGNNGPESGTIASPGCARKVICVGATYKNDRIYEKSSRGPTSIGTVKPDVVAPGVDIMSTNWKGGYTYKTGTSMATPHVAGAAALLLQVHLNWTAYEIKMTLKDTAVDLGRQYDRNTQGSGRIDVLRAVKLDQKLIIKSPDEIYEREYFTVSITDKNGTPVKACVLFITPFHLPRFRYGSQVWFRAPFILNRRIESLKGKIIVFKVFGKYEITRDITVVNES